jgi:hypothetical protein
LFDTEVNRKKKIIFISDCVENNVYL